MYGLVRKVKQLYYMVGTVLVGEQEIQNQVKEATALSKPFPTAGIYLVKKTTIDRYPIDKSTGVAYITNKNRNRGHVQTVKRSY